MRKVERGELLGLAEYEQIRPQFRSRIIAEKTERRLVAGEVSVTFENHDTVLFQIQEMLRTERITKEAAIDHEIETYNELVPGPNLDGLVQISAGDPGRTGLQRFDRGDHPPGQDQAGQEGEGQAHDEQDDRPKD